MLPKIILKNVVLINKSNVFHAKEKCVGKCHYFISVFCLKVQWLTWEYQRHVLKWQEYKTLMCKCISKLKSREQIKNIISRIYLYVYLIINSTPCVHYFIRYNNLYFNILIFKLFMWLLRVADLKKMCDGKCFVTRIWL